MAGIQPRMDVHSEMMSTRLKGFAGQKSVIFSAELFFVVRYFSAAALARRRGAQIEERKILRDLWGFLRGRLPGPTAKSALHCTLPFSRHQVPNALSPTSLLLGTESATPQVVFRGTNYSAVLPGCVGRAQHSGSAMATLRAFRMAAPNPPRSMGKAAADSV